MELYFIFMYIVFFVNYQVDARRQPKMITGCGKNGTCFKWPAKCQDDKCQTYITYLYRESSNQLTVTVMAKTDGWVAFGLNNQKRMMGGTVGEVCILSNTGPVLKGFINEETDFDMKELPKSVTVTTSSYMDGWLSCSYTRNVKDEYLKDLSKSWYLISSWGKTRVKHNEKKPKEHETGDYFWSKEKIDLKKVANIPVETFGWDLIAVHGSLMILAWVGFATSAIFYARYMREVWYQKACKGGALWFQLHRGFTISSAILAILSFVIIISEARSWNTEMGAHPVLGIIVIIIVCCQVIAGLARPAIGSARRTIFNLVHRYSGFLGFILATITLFLGFGALEVDLLVMIIFLIVVVITMVGMEARKFYKSRSVTEVPYRGEDFDTPEMEIEQPAALDSTEILFRKAAAFIVSCSGFFLAIVMISLLAHKCHVYLSKGKVS